MEPNKDYISVEQSIIGSLIEVKAMQAGMLPKKTWKEFLAELRAEDEHVVSEKQIERLVEILLEPQTPEEE